MSDLTPVPCAIVDPDTQVVQQVGHMSLPAIEHMRAAGQNVVVLRLGHTVKPGDTLDPADVAD